MAVIICWIQCKRLPRLRSVRITLYIIHSGYNYKKIKIKKPTKIIQNSGRHNIVTAGAYA